MSEGVKNKKGIPSFGKLKTDSVQLSRNDTLLSFRLLDGHIEGGEIPF